MGIKMGGSFGGLGASDADVAAVKSVTEQKAPPTVGAQEEAKPTEAPAEEEPKNFLKSEDTEQGDEGQPADASQTKPATVKQIKAGGKVYEIDFADMDKVERLVQLGIGARPAFSDRDKLTKENEALKAQIKQNQSRADAFAKLEQSAGDPNVLFQVLTGGKVSFDELVTREVARREQLAQMSPEERVKVESTSQMQRLQSQIDQLQKSLADKDAKFTADRDAAEKARFQTKLTTEFSKHSFADKIKDPVLAEELNESLWTLGVSRLEKYVEMHKLEEEDITPALVNKIFASTSKMLSAGSEQQVKTKVEQVVENKKKAAKEQAQAAATRSYGDEDMDKLSKLSPTKLFEMLKKSNRR